MYLAERMKERSTLSILSSFWYASWVGFLTWKKAKRTEQTFPMENLISDVQLKLPNTLPHLLQKNVNTHILIGPTFPSSGLCSPYSLFQDCLPHISVWPDVTYSVKILGSSSKKTSSSLTLFSLPTIPPPCPMKSYTFFIFWAPTNFVPLQWLFITIYFIGIDMQCICFPTSC